MNKKKILFILSSYSHGGTNKSLQNMLSLMDKNIFDFFIFTTNKKDYYKDIFSKYNIIECPSLLYAYSNSKCIFIRILRFIDRKINYLFFNILLKHFAKKTERHHTFDKVIAFEEGIQIRLIASVFKAIRISWVHCDYKLYYDLYKPNLLKEEKSFLLFDKIVCVSESTKQSLIKYFPSIENKSIYIHNILNTEEINIESNHTKLDNNFIINTFTIISIGRLHKVKQFEKIPYIAKEIINKQPNISFRWYIIGDGDSNIKNTILDEIGKYQLSKKVIYLGKKNNPYPYIKKANLLVVTSSSEAYPCVINEAKILKTPVLTTNFDSAHEIVDDKTGIISPLENFPNILINLINDIDMSYSFLKKNNSEHKFNNHNNLLKLHNLLITNKTNK